MCPALAAAGKNVKNNNEIELGFSTVLSGPTAPFETNTNAGQLLAIDMINSSDDILPGIKLIPTYSDDAGDLIPGGTGAICLLNRGVPLIIGPTYSSAAYGACSAVGASLLPLLSPSATAASLTKPGTDCPAFARVVASDADQSSSLVELAVSLGWRSFSVLYISDDPYSMGLLDSVYEKASLFDIAVAVPAKQGLSSAPSEQSMTQALKGIKSSGSRVIFSFLYPEQMALLLPVADRLGMVGKSWAWVGSDSWIFSVVALGERLNNPRLVSGALGTVPYIATDSPQWSAFASSWNAIPERANYTQAYNFTFLDPPYSSSPNVYAAYSYDAVYFAAKALDKVLRSGRSLLDREAVYDALVATRHDGATGEIRLNRGGDRVTTKFEILNAVDGGREARSAGIWTQGQGIQWSSTNGVQFYDGTSSPPPASVTYESATNSAASITIGIMMVLGLITLFVCVYRKLKKDDDAKKLLRIVDQGGVKGDRETELKMIAGTFPQSPQNASAFV